MTLCPCDFMLLKDVSFDDPLKNLVYDDVLLRLAEEGAAGEVLRFWESPVHFVVLGLAGNVDEDVDLEAVKRDRIAVLRRSSGGGTVLQGPGSLNYSLILSKEIHPEVADLKKSYAYILNNICRALESLGISAVFLPISDIALTQDRKKISGNAQKRGKKYILHHGTILYNLDIPLASRYLRMPKNVPEYREGRSHAEFIANISVPCSDIKSAIRQVFGAKEMEQISDAEQQLLDQLIRGSEKIISV